MSRTKIKENKKSKKGIIIAVAVILGAIALSSSNSTETKETAKQEATKQETQKPKKYIKCTTKELSDALDENALKASQTYKDKYLEVTGTFFTVDSDGKYFSLDCDTDVIFNVIHIQIDDDMLDTVANLKSGDKVTVKGECVDVGECLGYNIKAEEIK